MSSEHALVLGMLEDGLINVDQAERLILRLNRAVAAASRVRVTRRFKTARTGFVPPHFPSGFGTQATNLAY